jgi:uncharacterized protein YuzE
MVDGSQATPYSRIVVWLAGMSISRSDDAAYLYLTHIGDGDVAESFSTEEFFDDWRDAKEAIIDVGHDGRVLGLEWRGGDVPEVVRPDVRYRAVGNHAVVWLVEDGDRSVAKTVRLPTTDDYAVPGAVDLHFDVTGALIGIEAHDAARQLPRSLLDAAASASP